MTMAMDTAHDNAHALVPEHDDHGSTPAAWTTVVIITTAVGVAATTAVIVTTAVVVAVTAVVEVTVLGTAI